MDEEIMLKNNYLLYKINAFLFFCFLLGYRFIDLLHVFSQPLHHKQGQFF